MRWGQAEALWHEWDDLVEAGEEPGDILRGISLESIVEMLACADPGERRYDVDLLSTEIVNRLKRTERMLDQVTEAGVKAIEDLTMRVESAVPAVHRAEESLREASVAGEAPVSPDAYRSAAKASVSIESIQTALEKARLAEEQLLHLHDYRKGIARKEEDS